jgi:prolyl-tRNA synthetase
VDEQVKHVWTTSWGVSWRVLGGVIMAHGDDNGLVLPPAIAPHQVVIVPILRKGADDVLPAARALAAELGPVARVHLDDRPEQSAPWKFNEWELRGVPLRIELGKRDMDASSVTLARRDTLTKESVPRDEIAKRIPALLAEIQTALLERARAQRDARTTSANDKATLVAALRAQTGFVLAPWCERSECELDIKAETGAVTRVITGPAQDGERCAFCGEPAVVRAYFARSY